MSCIQHRFKTSYRFQTTSDKIGGMKKVLKGKVTRNPDLVNHGHEQQTGALAQKEKEADVS